MSAASVSPFWLSAFLDLPPDGFTESVAFWSAVTGYFPSAPRGEDGEFLTLEPPEGDDHLRVQRRGEGGPRIHLDLHVADIPGSVAAAESLGATLLPVTHPYDYRALRSPAGLTFCFVAHPAGRRTPPASWPGGHRSLVDQVCLDVPAAAYDEECRFWEALTGWTHLPSPSHDELGALERDEGIPLRILTQRLGDDDNATEARAHLDLASDDMAAEVERHEALGAERIGDFGSWTTMSDPSGMVYCVTTRDPDSRRPR